MGTITPLRHPPRLFSGEIAACTHLVQVYGEDGVLLHALEGFVTGALRAGDSALVIATSRHLHALEKRLREHGIDVASARKEARYIGELAEDVLDRFMVEGWPDEALFERAFCDLLCRARGEAARRVRVFSEAVAILWMRGEYAATLELERLWGRLCEAESLPVFCAYPRTAFASNAVESIVEICQAHSRVV